MAATKLLEGVNVAQAVWFFEENLFLEHIDELSWIDFDGERGGFANDTGSKSE